MEKPKGMIALISLAFAAGGILVLIFMTVFKVVPSKVSVGPIEFEIPTNAPPGSLPVKSCCAQARPDVNVRAHKPSPVG